MAAEHVEREQRPATQLREVPVQAEGQVQGPRHAAGQAEEARLGQGGPGGEGHTCQGGRGECQPRLLIGNCYFNDSNYLLSLLVIIVSRTTKRIYLLVDQMLCRYVLH